MANNGKTLEDVTDATGRQLLDDIFEESRMRRADLAADVAPEALAEMDLPSDPYVAFFAGEIQVLNESFEDGETLVIASTDQGRRYLLKRWNNRSTFKAYQSTPIEGEKLRLLNVYRVMVGQPVSVPG